MSDRDQRARRIDDLVVVGLRGESGRKPMQRRKGPERREIAKQRGGDRMTAFAAASISRIATCSHACRFARRCGDHAAREERGADEIVARGRQPRTQAEQRQRSLVGRSCGRRLRTRTQTRARARRLDRAEMAGRAPASITAKPFGCARDAAACAPAPRIPSAAQPPRSRPAGNGGGCHGVSALASSRSPAAMRAARCEHDRARMHRDVARGRSR